MAVTTSTVIAATALATTAVAGYQQYQSARDAARAQREGQDISSAQQQIEARRSRRQQVREERVRRARILQASANTGVASSSSETGSISALGTQTAANISNIQTGSLAARGISQQNQAFSSAQQRGQLWGTIGQIGGSAFQGAGGFSEAGVGGLFGEQGSGSGPSIQGGFTSEIFTIR